MKTNAKTLLRISPITAINFLREKTPIISDLKNPPLSRLTLKTSPMTQKMNKLLLSPKMKPNITNSSHPIIVTKNTKIKIIPMSTVMSSISLIRCKIVLKSPKMNSLMISKENRISQNHLITKNTNKISKSTFQKRKLSKSPKKQLNKFKKISIKGLLQVKEIKGEKLKNKLIEER